MQAANVVRSDWTGPTSPPNASHAVVALPVQGGVPTGLIRALGVAPATQAPQPTIPQGLAGYSAQGPDFWFISCHGGAGTFTLVAFIPRSMSSGQYWRTAEPCRHFSVLLVDRSHASGLCDAQAVARQWAVGVLPNVRLPGPVVDPDAPGKTAKPLKGLLPLISGGVPGVWELPWVEALRLGYPPKQTRLPSAYSRLAKDLQRIISEDARA
jgi:hypothetical protein